MVDARASAANAAQVTLRPVNQSNWRAVANLKVFEFEAQREFVAEPSYYLALCCYGNDWQPPDRRQLPRRSGDRRRAKGENAAGAA